MGLCRRPAGSSPLHLQKGAGYSPLPFHSCGPRWRRSLGAVPQGYVGSGVGGSDVVCARADEAVVVVLLEHMCGPTGDTADGEDRGEEIDVDAERGVGRRGVEVDIGVELLLGLDEELDLARHVEPLGT